MKPNDTPPPTDDLEADNAAPAGCMARLVRGSFTPGPWTIGDENNQHIEICIGDAVANLERQDRYGLHMVFSREEMRANGRLIAAAPDMLDALERIRDYQGRFGEDDPQSIASDILDKIYSANA